MLVALEKLVERRLWQLCLEMALRMTGLAHSAGEGGQASAAAGLWAAGGPAVLRLGVQPPMWPLGSYQEVDSKRITRVLLFLCLL